MFFAKKFHFCILLLFLLIVQNILFNYVQAAVYSSNGKYGYTGTYNTGYKGYWIDLSKEHKFNIPPEYDKIELLEECFEETYLLVTKDNKKTIIRHNNVPVFSYNKYKNLEKIYGWAGLNYVKVTSHNGKYGAYLWDKNIVPAKYDNIEFYPANIIVTKKNFKGLYNSDGKLLIPVIYDRLFFEKDVYHYVIAVKNNKYGVFSTVSTVETPILDLTYDYINKDNHIVKKGKLYGKYSMNGYDNLVLPVNYDKIEVLDKENDLYKIYQNNKVGLFQRDKIICPPKYDTIEPSGDIHYTVKLNGKYGLIAHDFENDSIKILLPVIYDEIYIEDNDSDVYYLKKDNKKSFYSKRQNKIIP
ncbi:WG repeat-containing protein [bacterium]|nr:WG repeat-containing protein [bacterium]